VTPSDCLGYAASLLVLGTFCMTNMVALRAMAICSNLTFIAYGWLAGIEPVLLLHFALLPMNLWRLAQSLAPEGLGGAASQCHPVALPIRRGRRAGP
jgi:CRP/FNR family transcriptional regulator, cyclic AMP receptor protein